MVGDRRHFVRPRAEEVYRTLKLLNEGLSSSTSPKATQTLSTKADRPGTPPNRDAKHLAAPYFENRDYRDGVSLARNAASSFPERATTDTLVKQAQTTFEDLYLSGAADARPSCTRCRCSAHGAGQGRGRLRARRLRPVAASRQVLRCARQLG